MKKYKINLKRFIRSLVLTVAIFSTFTWASVSLVSALTADEINMVETRVVVTYGDTLWGIAREYKAESQDIREYVNTIKQLNGLSDANLRVGQSLTILIPEGEE